MVLTAAFLTVLSNATPFPSPEASPRSQSQITRRSNSFIIEANSPQALTFKAIIAGIDSARQKLNELNYSPMRSTIANPIPPPFDPTTKIKDLKHDPILIFSVDTGYYLITVPRGYNLPVLESFLQVKGNTFTYDTNEHITRRSGDITVRDFVTRYSGSIEPLAIVMFYRVFARCFDAIKPSSAEQEMIMSSEEWTTTLREKFLNTEGIIPLVTS
ncbi:MAG: hypothetical protein M1829_005688 [Trizodia sp. TS-e1964]|nr:MAG: hypothetical protein M1829_005688 [Trizodia sp. TS-e1964]